MDKGIGFIRTIFLPWLDVAAELRLHTDDPAVFRNDLENIVARDVNGEEARRKSVDVLMGIWWKSRAVSPALYDEMLAWLPEIPQSQRIWAHYGLTLLAYPFFRQCARAIGFFAATGESFTRDMLVQRLSNELGQLGSLERAGQRVAASLQSWGALVPAESESSYLPLVRVFAIKNPAVETWLAACALWANPAEDIAVLDLLHLPELYPFSFTISSDDLRKHPLLEISRQGSWNMVRVKDKAPDKIIK